MQGSTPTQVWRIFESIADCYDGMNTIISFKQHQAWRKQSLKYLKLQPGEKVLDLCCGTGDWTIPLAERVGKRGKVYALDFSPAMLVQCQRKIAQAKLPNIELHLGNALHLPFSDNYFDAVTIGFGLRNTNNYGQVLQEMYRVLKPAGQAACLETSLPTMPLFKQLYLLYFRFIMPLLGKLLTGNYQAYSWLMQSTYDFPNKLQLANHFTAAGFKQIEVYSYFGGVAALHLGIK